MTDLVTTGGAEMTETSWRPRTELSFAQWEDVGRNLQRMGRAWQWWIGDWIRYGEQRWGEKYDQAIDIVGLEYSTLASIVYVSGRIESCRRRQDLSWSLHAEVAKFDADEQDEWLDRAATEGMTVQRLRGAISQRESGPAPSPPEPGGVEFLSTITLSHYAEDGLTARAAVERAQKLLEGKGFRAVRSKVVAA